jgi:Fe-S cluster assembly protein SufD
MGITHTLERADARPRSIASTDVNDFPVPHGREEDWRFTPLARLRGLHDGSAALGGKLHVSVDAPAGVTVETVDRADARIGRTGAPTDRVAAAAWSAFAEATVVSVAKEAHPDRPVWVSVTGDSFEKAAHAHLVIDVAPFATAVVVLDHSGDVLLADNVEIVVGDGANLTVVSLQDWSDDSVHLTHHRALVGRDARFKAVHITLGGDLVRVAPSVAYAGPGGDAELWGLFFADSGQHLEHRLFVDHEAPHCRSRVTYKGALQGEQAHTVWIGDVLIRSKAIGTDTYELNRNLILTDGARADSVPNLEIETGEVTGAGHASATGRFDDEQLFYLQSRGIPAEEARRLVVRGFFHEVLQQVGIDELEARLVAKVERELEGHGV